MTLKSQIEADVASVFINTDEFGTSATHKPRNKSGSEAPVDVVFIEDQPSRYGGRGETARGVTRTGKLYAPSTVEVTVDDKWTIDGEDWWVQHIKGKVGGMTMMEVQRHDHEHGGFPRV